MNSFLSFDGDKSFEKLDRIVRIFEIADLLEKGSIPSIFKSAMLSKPAEFWFDTWNTKNGKLFEIISWMDEENIVDIG